MIRLAQAASSEIHTKENPGLYGTPPNQLRTGVTANKPQGNLDGELNVIPFYDGEWRAVFRPTDPTIAEKIASLAYNIVANGSIYGYGQQVSGGGAARTALFDALAKLDKPNPWAVYTPVNCDCSSLVGACVYFAGIVEPLLRQMNTTSEPNVLMGTGDFVRLEDASLLKVGCGARRGDIFWKYGHTAICLDNDETQETTPCKIWNCSACNMRSGYSTDYPIIQTLHPGNLVNVISTASTGWKQIEIGGLYGFVSPKYVVELEKAIISGGNVWMRTKAGDTSEKTRIMVIPGGSIVHLTGNITQVGLTKWFDVIFNGKRGWSSGKFVKPL